MAINPLQKYFRQPKVFIKLPSGGIYSRPGTVQGDPANVPVYGMTGMDEIIVRTPDALLSGESTATVVGSCVPAIKDPWDLCILDLVLILAAIRIATYGNNMAIGHTCANCGADNDYDIDLNKVIEFYMNCQYESKIVLKDITINLKPLNYKASTEFNLRNFRLQQRIAQAEVMDNTQERQDLINGLFKELAAIQTEIYKVTIDSVDIGDQVVTETAYILEWLDNCDKAVFDAIKQINQKNTDTWTMPKFPVQCDECETAVNLTVDLDQSNFFVRA
jgi:hypothetical protein